MNNGLEISSSLQWTLGVTIVVYLIVMYIIGYIAERKIENVEDFIVAGRHLPLSLAWMSILATWFGAGTMLTASDEVRKHGLQKAALDPLGAGCCLLFTAMFVAAPMWRMQLLTVPDFFRRKFGPKAEMVSSCILVPSYFGWIAAQFTALADMLEMFFRIPLRWGVFFVALVGTGYTMMGGMWSVTLVDAVQIGLILFGLIIMAGVVLWKLGEGDLWAGLERIATDTDPDMLIVIPTDDAVAIVGWIGVFAIGALGNMPGQDLLQRVFASDSERTAKRACFVAGVLYLIFGAIPILLALAGNLLFPQSMEARILPALTQAFLHPALAVVFLLALLSAILSTIASAILSPAAVMAQNILPRVGEADTLKSNRYSILFVAFCSLVLAYLGESAYELLEEAYLLTLVGLFVPLMIGLYSFPKSGRAAMASMLTGMGLWLLHFAMGWETFLEPAPGFASWKLPFSLAATFCGLLAFFVFEPPWKIAWSKNAAAPEDSPASASMPHA